MDGIEFNEDMMFGGEQKGINMVDIGDDEEMNF